MINPALVRQLAERGFTKSAAAKELGTTRQRIWQIAKSHDITFTAVSARKGSHTHGEGKRPAYLAGCEDCRYLMRTWVRNRRKTHAPKQD